MAAKLEESGSISKLPFTISEPEFDQSTYYGRFRSFQKSCNPRNALYTNKQIADMR